MTRHMSNIHVWGLPYNGSSLQPHDTGPSCNPCTRTYMCDLPYNGMSLNTLGTETSRQTCTQTDMCDLPYNGPCDGNSSVTMALKHTCATGHAMGVEDHYWSPYHKILGRPRYRQGKAGTLERAHTEKKKNKGFSPCVRSKPPILRSAARNPWTIGFIAAALEQEEYKAEQLRITLQDRLGNETIGDIVDQHKMSDSTNWLNINDFFRGDNGDFTTIREVSGSSHDIPMICHGRLHVVGCVANGPWWSWWSCHVQEDEDDNEEQEPTEAAAQVDTLATTSSGASRPGSLLGAEVPVPLLAIEDAKSDEYHKAADMISGALDQLGEQLQQHLEAQQAEWVHSTEEPSSKICTCCVSMPTWRVNGVSANRWPYQHSRRKSSTIALHIPNQVITVNLGDLMPYLDDYAMCRRRSIRGGLHLVYGRQQTYGVHLQGAHWGRCSAASHLCWPVYYQGSEICCIQCSRSCRFLQGCSQKLPGDKEEQARLAQEWVELIRSSWHYCSEPWRLSPADDSASSRTEDVAPHHEPDIAHHDACWGRIAYC